MNKARQGFSCTQLREQGFGRGMFLGYIKDIEEKKLHINSKSFSLEVRFMKKVNF